jgi:hypothetical protein
MEANQKDTRREDDPVRQEQQAAYVRSETDRRIREFTNLSSPASEEELVAMPQG